MSIIPSPPDSSTLSGASVQRAEGNEFNNIGRDMIKVTVVTGPNTSDSVFSTLLNLLGAIFTPILPSSTSDTAVASRNNSPSRAITELESHDPGSFSELPSTTVEFPQDVSPSSPPLLESLTCTVSSLSPTSSISERYTRSMLEYGSGYPLYEPEPASRQRGKGVKVGDVGIVTEDGGFDFLFNVCPSRSGQANPTSLPDDFETLESPEIADKPHFQPETRLFSNGINRLESPHATYKCIGQEGAILELPVGAIRFEADNKLDFKDLAARHAESWYKYTVTTRRRDVPNGSLYLVTSCIKCTYWGIAVFNRPSTPEDYLRFILSESQARSGQSSQTAYRWRGSGGFIAKVAPNPSDEEDLDQCVFLRGYKIMLRKDIWDSIKNPSLTTNPYSATSPAPSTSGSYISRQVSSSSPNDNSQGSTPSSYQATNDRANTGFGYRRPGNSWSESGRVILEANPNMSSPSHPSDLVNVVLLLQERGAKVALTHDDDWCDLLTTNEESSVRSAENVAMLYTSIVDRHGSVSLVRRSSTLDVQAKQEDSKNIPAQTSNIAGDNVADIPLLAVPRTSPSTRQPASQPSTSTPQRTSEPSTSTPQPASKPSTSTRQPATTSTRQPATKPSTSTRQPATKPSTSTLPASPVTRLSSITIVHDPDDPFKIFLLPPPEETPQERLVRELKAAEEKRKSDLIDESIRKEKDALKNQKFVRVLLVGQAESGKSTTLKNFRYLYAHADWVRERAGWRSVIQFNLIRSILTIIDALRAEIDGNGGSATALRRVSTPYKLDDSDVSSLSSSEGTGHHRPGSPAHLSERVRKILLRLAPLRSAERELKLRLGAASEEEVRIEDPHQVNATPFVRPTLHSLPQKEFSVTRWNNVLEAAAKFERSSELVSSSGKVQVLDGPTAVISACREDIKLLWTDGAVRSILRKRNIRMEYSPGFFLDDLDRIATQDYEPTDEDILRARLGTFGVQEYRLRIKSDSPEWIFYDVGGARTMRATWIPYFDNINAIIFLAPVSAFDERLQEDPRVNRLEDSTLLWKSICSSKLLVGVTLVLFLNKCDILDRKLKNGVLVAKYLTTYGNRPNDSATFLKYLTGHFKAMLKRDSPDPNRRFYCHATAVVDINATSKIIGTVQHTVLEQHLKYSSVM